MGKSKRVCIDERESGNRGMKRALGRGSKFRRNGAQEESKEVVSLVMNEAMNEGE